MDQVSQIRILRSVPTVIRNSQMFRIDLLRWLGAHLRQWHAGRSGARVGAEVVLRSTPSYSIAALWINVLGDHGIPARSASDLASSFMGDGVEHRVIVRADQAEEATRVLAAFWADPTAAARSGEQGANGRRMNAQ
jgi:Flp pilus assembly secretin CpaC